MYVHDCTTTFSVWKINGWPTKSLPILVLNQYPGTVRIVYVFIFKFTLKYFICSSKNKNVSVI